MPRRTLAERLQSLEAKKAILQERQALLKERERKARNARIFELGRLIDKAGLLSMPPNILLGALMEVADQATDPAKRQQWEQRGSPILSREMTVEPA